MVSSRLPASADTGAGAAPTTVPAPVPTPTPQPAQVRVYLGSRTGTGGPDIGSGTADPLTGQLSIGGWRTDLTDPSWLERAPDGASIDVPSAAHILFA